MLKDMSFFYLHQEYLQSGDTGRSISLKEETIFGDFGSWQQASLKGLKLFNQDLFFVKYCP
jgi:hypothetical protein